MYVESGLVNEAFPVALGYKLVDICGRGGDTNDDGESNGRPHSGETCVLTVLTDYVTWKD